VLVILERLENWAGVLKVAPGASVHLSIGPSHAFVCHMTAAVGQLTKPARSFGAGAVWAKRGAGRIIASSQGQPTATPTP